MAKPLSTVNVPARAKVSHDPDKRLLTVTVQYENGQYPKPVNKKTGKVASKEQIAVVGSRFGSAHIGDGYFLSLYFARGVADDGSAGFDIE